MAFLRYLRERPGGSLERMFATGTARLRFEVTRPAEYEVRVAGPGLDSIIARGSTSGSRTTMVAWPALRGEAPVPAGDYDLSVTVAQFGDRYARPLRVRVRHGAVDTLPHLDRIGGEQAGRLEGAAGGGEQPASGRWPERLQAIAFTGGLQAHRDHA